MSESQPTSRRWFQFRLRTMFIGVTLLGVLAAWIGYKLNWIRERHEFIDRSGAAIGDGPYHIVRADPVAPRLLWLFGEAAYEYIIVFPAHAPGSLTPDEKSQVDRVSRLFPEATVEAHSPQ